MSGRDATTALTRSEIALIGLVLLAPTLATVFVLPTYHIDTIETVNWGRYFQLGTPKHPPLMTWLGGIADRLPFADGWGSVALQTLVNLAGAAYLAGVARLVLPAYKQRLFIVALLLSMNVGFWSLSGHALNADQVQIPFWAGALYHLMKARQTPASPIHWVLAGIMLALAFLSKYFVVVLAVPLLGASVIVPEYRALWKTYGPWLALAVALVLAIPHILWVLDHRFALSYGAGRLNSSNPLESRIGGIAAAASGLIFLAIPYVSILTVAFWRRRAAFVLDLARPDGPDERFFSLSQWLMLAFIALLVLAGIPYEMRFDAPVAGLFLLLWMVILPVRQEEADVLHRLSFKGALIIWAVVYAVLAIVYLNVTHRYAQEPANAAADAIKADWNARFSCGPAYVIGERHAAHSIGVYYREGVLGIPLEDRQIVTWYDEDRAKAEGVIVVAWNDYYLDRLKEVLPVGADLMTVTAPLRRTFASRTETYWYAFIAPEDCAGRGKNQNYRGAPQIIRRVPL